MIAAVQDLASGRSDEGGSKNTGDYLEACNLLFEQGMRSHHRINNSNRPVLTSIRKGMTYFEQWCADHEETGNFIFKAH